MLGIRRTRWFVTLLALAAPLAAQVPDLLDYQGRIAVSGTPFSGSGQFNFALVDAAGTTTFWSNDDDSGAQLLAPDRRVVAVAYAIQAASVVDGEPAVVWSRVHRVRSIAIEPTAAHEALQESPPHLSLQTSWLHGSRDNYLDTRRVSAAQTAGQPLASRRQLRRIPPAAKCLGEVDGGDLGIACRRDAQCLGGQQRALCVDHFEK